MSHSELESAAVRLEQDVLEHYQTIRFAPFQKVLITKIIKKI
jgi:hypothetical protein